MWNRPSYTADKMFSPVRNDERTATGHKCPVHLARVTHPVVFRCYSYFDGVCVCVCVCLPSKMSSLGSSSTHFLDVDLGRSYLGDTLQDLGHNPTICACPFSACCP